MIINPEDFCAVEASATPGRWNVWLHPAYEGVEPIPIDSHRSERAAEGQANEIRHLFATKSATCSPPGSATWATSRRATHERPARH